MLNKPNLFKVEQFRNNYIICIGVKIWTKIVLNKLGFFNKNNLFCFFVSITFFV